MNAQAIHQAIVEVRYADPPREGKKRATIKTPAGEVYFLKPEHLGLFRKGRRYRIDYTESDWQGRPIRNIVKFEAEAPAPTSIPQDSPKGAGDASPAEADFVSRCLAASIASCSVGRSKEERLAAVKMLREVWREGFA
jgi:hypothetical protein